MVTRAEQGEHKRTKPDWYYNQVAALPFRYEKNRLEILLITSIKKQKWILPKGIAQQNVSPAESAAIEAREEAGVKGTVVNESLGSYSVKKWGGICKVHVYPMEIEEEQPAWPENGARKRKWFTPEDALKSISNAQLTDIIRQFSVWFRQYKTQAKI